MNTFSTYIDNYLKHENCDSKDPTALKEAYTALVAEIPFAEVFVMRSNDDDESFVANDNGEIQAYTDHKLCPAAKENFGFYKMPLTHLFAFVHLSEASDVVIDDILYFSKSTITEILSNNYNYRTLLRK